MSTAFTRTGRIVTTTRETPGPSWSTIDLLVDQAITTIEPLLAAFDHPTRTPP